MAWLLFVFGYSLLGMRPLVILTPQHGRVGNRLTLFAHVVACAMANDLRVINTALAEYASLFEMASNDPFVRFPPRSSRLAALLRYPLLERLIRTVVHDSASIASMIVLHLRTERVKTLVLGYDLLDLGSPGFLSVLQRSRVVFLRGYRYRDPGSLSRHSDRIRTLLKPVARTEAAIDRILGAARAPGSVLVGVHVRQTDVGAAEERIARYSLKTYGTSVEIKTAFALDEFVGVMRRLVALLAGRAVVFVVTSDVRLQPSDFPGLTVVLGSGDVGEDLYLLARCDYIVGPGSTYSGWAAFHGKVPLYWMTARDVDPSAISLEEFRVPHQWTGFEVRMPDGSWFIY